MSDLIGISVDIPVSPKISFHGSIESEGQRNGWGLAWYPDQELRATALRYPSSGDSSGITEVMADWDLINTPLMMAHRRSHTSRAIYRDTHPFIFNFRGSSWTMAHTGELVCDLDKEFPIDEDFPIQPLGSSDTERVFVWILQKLHDANANSIKDFGFSKFADLLRHINKFGTFTTLLSDGRSLLGYSCSTGSYPLYWTRHAPGINSHEQRAHHNASNHESMSGNGIDLKIQTYNTNEYCLSLFSSTKFNDSFSEIPPGCTLITQRGGLVYEKRPEDLSEFTGITVQPQTIPEGPDRKKLHVVHTTKYTYENPVEKSSHRFRLAPVIDDFQSVYNYSLNVSVHGFQYSYEDVFANKVIGLDVDATYQELIINTSSIVDIKSPVDIPELIPYKQTIPMFWMPWQAKMMQSYLLPPELPESQLRVLTDYAKSFAARNKGELLSTLEDITWTIFSDYQYQQGSTTIRTTPYEVYETRRGVCQDFANLMICLSRLLNIPARYRVGYIFTGSDYENIEQSEASHAWVEVYLPMFGWRGYDPTNGCKARGNHIRVATGRNYIDATPTSGVVYVGGGGEKMQVDVQVNEVLD